MECYNVHRTIPVAGAPVKATIATRWPEASRRSRPSVASVAGALLLHALCAIMLTTIHMPAAPDRPEDQTVALVFVTPQSTAADAAAEAAPPTEADTSAPPEQLAPTPPPTLAQAPVPTETQVPPEASVAAATIPSPTGSPPPPIVKAEPSEVAPSTPRPRPRPRCRRTSLFRPRLQHQHKRRFQQRRRRHRRYLSLRPPSRPHLSLCRRLLL
jgi:hypothetical protein